jgi:hypothetical protein
VAYAALGDVQARAGALSGAWTANSKPSTGDITTFLDDVAAEIDAALAGRGLAITDPASPAGKALKNVNALGALVLALQATYPEGSGPSSASKAIDDARGEFDGLMASIMDGTHPAVRSLEAGRRRRGPRRSGSRSPTTASSRSTRASTRSRRTRTRTRRPPSRAARACNRGPCRI